MAKKNIPIGFDQLYYAVMTDEETETYGAPVRLPGAMTLSISPNVDDADLYADDIMYATVKNLSKYDVELGTAELATADKAAILGHSIDANGGLIEKTTDLAPYVAILYRRRMFNGKFRYSVIHKIKFAPSDEEQQTKGESVEFQTPMLEGTAISRETDEIARFSVTEGDPGVTAGFLSTFFDAVFVPGADTTAPTVTVVPADAATGIAVGANIVWTFSEPIRSADITSSNFFLLDDTLTPVAGVLSVNTAGDEVTLNPSVDLDAATAYTAMVTTNVADQAGNALAAPSITTFTTA